MAAGGRYVRVRPCTLGAVKPEAGPSSAAGGCGEGGGEGEAGERGGATPPGKRGRGRGGYWRRGRGREIQGVGPVAGERRDPAREAAGPGGKGRGHWKEGGRKEAGL